MGTDQSQQIYTTSLNFRKAKPTDSSRALATGNLDDWLILSFGIWDKSSHFIEVKVEDVLRGHTMCENVIGPIN